MIQSLPTKSAVGEGFSLASQHVDIKFLISPRLVGMTDSFFRKNRDQPPKFVILNSEGRARFRIYQQKSAVEEGFSLASQHFAIKFLLSLRLVGMTDSFV